MKIEFPIPCDDLATLGVLAEARLCWETGSIRLRDPGVLVAFAGPTKDPRRLLAARGFLSATGPSLAAPPKRDHREPLEPPAEPFGAGPRSRDNREPLNPSAVPFGAGPPSRDNREPLKSPTEPFGSDSRLESSGVEG